ncbi:MAG TPA: T9SS type A sorting domain-containing protein, partial [Rhodothermales bacterium]|nr:T9SS type A sorting domain-containing protein [Rhodothermales bacterium]
DGRVYVGQVRAGCCYSPYVYRTADPLTVASEGSPAPAGSGLTLRAEPNPSAGAVALLLTLPTAEAQVRVTVYDSLGREVAVAHEGPLGAGAHRLGLDTGGLAPGVYVARVTAGGAAATARLTLAR